MNVLHIAIIQLICMSFLFHINIQTHEWANSNTHLLLTPLTIALSI